MKFVIRENCKNRKKKISSLDLGKLEAIKTGSKFEREINEISFHPEDRLRCNRSELFLPITFARPQEIKNFFINEFSI